MSLRNLVSIPLTAAITFLTFPAHSKEGQISFGSHRLGPEVYSIADQLLVDLAAYNDKWPSESVTYLLEQIGPELENISFRLIEELPRASNLKDLCTATDSRLEGYFSEREWSQILHRGREHKEIVALRLYCLSGLPKNDLPAFLKIVDSL